MGFRNVARALSAAGMAFVLSLGTGCAEDGLDDGASPLASTSAELSYHHIEWKMAPRARAMADAYHYLNGVEHYRSEYVFPSAYTVQLSRSDYQAGDQLDWRLDELAPAAATVTSGLLAAGSASVSVPRQGMYRVRSTRVRAGVTTVEETTINVRDVVIAILGDSMSSGEGVPDVAGRYYYDESIDQLEAFLSGDFDPPVELEPVQWLDSKCHRSLRSGSALAAIAYEGTHPHLSVTLLDFACSGATISDLIGPEVESGDTPPGGGGGDGTGPGHGQQQNKVGGKGTQLEALMFSLTGADGTRPVDDLIMSIGLNDIGFADLVVRCATPAVGSCINEHLYDLRMEHVAERYQALHQKIVDTGVVNRVHLLEYPGKALLSVPGGNASCGVLGSIDSSERGWFEDLATDLAYTQTTTLASFFGWDRVTGIDDALLGHGYCSGGADRYFGVFNESMELQGDYRGMVHPNFRGHVELGKIIKKALDGSELDYVGTLAYPDVNRGSATAPTQADVCARGPQGIVCTVSNGTDFTAATRLQPEFSDAAGFGARRYADTTQFPDLNGDGKADVCVRGADGLYCALSTATGFGPRKLWGPAFSDEHFGSETRYATLSYPDLDHDGKADACALSFDGVYCGLSNGTSFGPVTRWTTSGFSGHVYEQHKYVDTLRFVNVNDDAFPDVCSRVDNGVQCALSDGTRFAAATQWSTKFGDGDGWGSPRFYETMEFVDLNNDHRADVCARGQSAVYCALSTGTSFAAPTKWATNFRDDQGFDDPSSYVTLTYPDINHDERADICARGPDGIRCAVSNGTTFLHYSLWLAGFDDSTTVQTKRQYYETIAFPDLNGDGAADFCGRGTAGMWCTLSDGVSHFGSLTLRDTLFADKNGWLSGTP